MRGSDLASLGFREGNRILAVKLKTKPENLFFSLSQNIEGKAAEGDYRLTKKTYGYRLLPSAVITDQALIRSEFEPMPNDGPPAYHIQSDATAGKLDLNRLHVPTGRVMIEHVIRFLIVELGHKPPCGDEWPNVLEKSERKYLDDSASHRYKRPDGWS
ncbi:MAG: hypothetical protein H7Z43_07480 [Clostridia bacterium]|nr:hypothetical protein [Deltaproteobacteria bacterium]